MRIAVFMTFFVFIMVVLPLSANENFKYDPKNNRDPFRPLVDRSGNILPEVRPIAANVQLNLEGIVWSSKADSYAIVGGMVVRKGDMLGDYRVKTIQKTSVILERGNEESVINLRSEDE